MGATLWLLLTVSGFAALRVAGRFGHDLLVALLVRLAAFCFAGAGVIGAGGWLGSFLGRLVHTVSGAGAHVGAATIGTTAVWVVWALACVAWVLTLLPERWFAGDMPDWLAISGLILPSLSASIPGRMGHALSGAIHTCGHLMVELARQLVTG